MHTAQYLLTGNRHVRPFAYTAQYLLTGNRNVRLFAYTAQYLPKGNRHVRPFAYTAQYLLAWNMDLRPYMHTAQYLLTGNRHVRPFAYTAKYPLAWNMDLRPYMHTAQYLLTGNMNLRPYMHTAQYLLTGNMNLRPYMHTAQYLTGNRVMLHWHTPTQCNMHEYLALARVSCNVPHLILGVSEKTTGETENCWKGRGDRKCGTPKHRLPNTTAERTTSEWRKQTYNASWYSTTNSIIVTRRPPQPHVGWRKRAKCGICFGRTRHVTPAH